MSGGSSTIPADAKLQIPPDSLWARYPQVFGAIGLAALLLAFVISAVTHDPSGDAHHGSDSAVQHQESGGELALAKAGHDEEGSKKHANDEGAKKSKNAHGDEAHAKGNHGAGGSAHSNSDHAEEGHAEDGHGHGQPPRFWFSYLTAYMYGLSLALGGLFFVIIQFLVKAGWSVVVRRIAENVMGTLPLFAVLFIPVAIGLQYTHSHWWNVEVGVDKLLDGKRAYLNQGFFLLRAIVYLGVWSGLAVIFLRNSTRQDESGDHDITRRLQAYSPVGIILFGLTVTFAAIDWMKTMDPHWYSTMWGVYYFAGCVVGIFATLAVLILWLQRDGFVHHVINVEHRHDVGKLLFGFTVFWTYITFSQYFLIWYANIPEEQLWFDHRAHGGWRNVGIFLAVGHFFIPFFFLLIRAVKRNPVTLFIGASWMLFVHYVDIYFIIMPVYSSTFGVSIIDVLALLGVVMLFLAGFSYLAARSSLIPVKDPRLPESLRFENF